jgi:ParB family chromosome partitioning protein
VRGVELTGETEIDATIVEADKAEAQLIEITENLFRNELSTLDRAIFVATYREVWQDKYGKIEAGRPGNRINLIQLIEDEAGKGFSEHVAERLGLSVASVKRLNQIAQNLHPDVRVAVRGTPIADNQSELLKIAKMEPKQQRRLAIAFRDEKDIRKARDLVEGATQPAKLDPEVLVDAMVAKLVAAWEGASLFARERFLVEVGIEPDPQMSSIIGEAE